MKLGSTCLIAAMCCLTKLLAVAAVIYTNGAVNRQVNGYWFAGSFEVSDSFTVSDAASVTGFDLGIWVQAGGIPISTNWSIGTSFFGSDVASGSSSLTNTYLFTNDGYDIYLSSVTGLNVPIGPGTYYLTLTAGICGNCEGFILWDENDGPSQARWSESGDIPSESFTIYGSTVPEPTTLLLLGTAVGCLFRRVA